MNQALRWMLILGCLMLAALEAPHSSALVAEDLAGPYCGPPAAKLVAVERAPLLLARSERERDRAGSMPRRGTR